MTYILSFETSYHQFYLADKLTVGDTTGDFWSGENYKNRLGIGDGILGIGTKSYGPIKGELSVLARPKDAIDYDCYDHIVEGGLNIQSGVLQVLECPSNNVELEAQILSGKYRVRVYSSNLDSVKDPDQGGDDYYKIEIWPDNNMEVKVLKEYASR